MDAADSKKNGEEEIEEHTHRVITQSHAPHKLEDFHERDDPPDKPCQKYGKIGFLFLIWLFMTG